MGDYFGQFWCYYLSQNRVVIYIITEEEEEVAERKAGLTGQTFAWYQSRGQRRRMMSCAAQMSF